MSRIQTNGQTVLNAVQATGVSTVVDISDAKNVGVQLSLFGTATASIKFQISFSDKAPDFSAAASETNHWEYVNYVPHLTGSVVAGSTAIDTTTTDVFKNYVINIDMAKWFSVEVVTYGAGSVTAVVIKSDNQ